MLNKKEKQVVKSLLKYHLNEIKKDSMMEDIVSVMGAEAKYKKVLKDIMKKL